MLFGSAIVTGLAGKERSVLQTKGIDEVTIADAGNTYTGTLIVNRSNSKDPATKQLLNQLFPGTVVTSATGSTEADEAANYPNANFVVILGQNWDT